MRGKYCGFYHSENEKRKGTTIKRLLEEWQEYDDEDKLEENQEFDIVLRGLNSEILSSTINLAMNDELVFSPELIESDRIKMPHDQFMMERYCMTECSDEVCTKFPNCLFFHNQKEQR